MVYSTSASFEANRALRAALRDHGTDLESITNLTTHSASLLVRQSLYAVVGIIAMLVVYRIDYERYKKYAKPLLWASFFLLMLCYLQDPGKGARRWIRLGPINLQASEVAKLAMILYMAKQLTERRAELRSLVRGFLPSLCILGLFLGAIVFEPDLGAAVMLGMIVYIMWFVSGMRITHLVSVVALVFIPGVILAIATKGYRMDRVTSFLDPFTDLKGKGWQLSQSLISIGTGGLSGLGLGKGPQKYQFLSEGHTDFIYAGICEEFGMIGGITIFLIYSIFMIQGLRIASKAPDMYGSLIATGISVMIGIQAFVNMYVVLGLVPTKGLTLPLVSYGGSSLIINCIAVGILMNISRYTEIASAVPRREALSSAPSTA